MTDTNQQNKSLVLSEVEQAIEPPTLYHVILLNDDYTPMDFVVEVLMKFFSKNLEEAYEIMLNVHQQERGVAGTFAKEIAIEKRNQTVLSAKANQFPLNCVVEAA